MTLNLVAIFGAGPSDAIAPTVVEPSVDDPLADVAKDPAEWPPGDIGNARPVSWPINEGVEHFSLWVDDSRGPWPEFITGQHYDIRQPSRLRGLLAPQNTFELIVSKTIAPNAPRIAPSERNGS